MLYCYRAAARQRLKWTAAAQFEVSKTRGPVGEKALTAQTAVQREAGRIMSLTAIPPNPEIKYSRD